MINHEPNGKLPNKHHWRPYKLENWQFNPVYLWPYVPEPHIGDYMLIALVFRKMCEWKCASYKYCWLCSHKVLFPYSSRTHTSARQVRMWVRTLTCSLVHFIPCISIFYGISHLIVAIMGYVYGMLIFNFRLSANTFSECRVYGGVQV